MKTLTLLSGLILAYTTSALSANTVPIGTWKTNTIVIPIIGSKSVFKLEITENNKAYLQHRNTLELPIGGGVIAMQIDDEYDFVIGREVDSVEGAYELDRILVKMIFTPLSDHLATSMNHDKYCGYTDWEVGVGKDVTDKPCGDNGEITYPKGRTWYDIIKYDEETLLLGNSILDENQGSTVENRPTSLAYEAETFYKE